MDNSKNWVIAAVIAVLVIIGGVWIFSASSDDDDIASNDTQTSEQVQEEVVVEEPNIVELAAETPQLSTLVAAVEAADLVETLSGPGPFTVFAPINQAFNALPDGTLDSLLEPENQAELQKVLTYHVVAGEALSTDLSNGQKIETVEGQEITVKINDNGVMINDAKVVTPDVQASNGVVHIIDAVLLPQ